MPAVPLPARPSLEQLKKQARLLQRAVRAGHPKALALVAEHQPGGAVTGTFSLDAAQFVLARGYGFASWPKLRQHLATLVLPPETQEPVSPVLTVANRYHARPGWADEEDIRRCASTYPEIGAWRPVLTTHHNGVTLIAFATAAGPRFCELTPTTITLSHPGDVPPPPGQATLTFHTMSGSLAGVVAPEVTSLSLERPTDLLARQHVVIADGIFAVPNAFTVTPAGLVFRVNHNRTGDIVAADALPGRAACVADRPPRADRESPAGRRLAAAIAAADAPPVVDPGQWTPGVYLELTDDEQLQLGRYGNLLGWHVTDRDGGLFVFEFGPRQCPLGEFAVVGETITATRFYYDFRDRSSGTVAVVGLVNDERVASVTLSRKGEPDAAAALGEGTFVMPAIVGLSEGSSSAHLTTATRPVTCSSGCLTGKQLSDQLRSHATAWRRDR